MLYEYRLSTPLSDSEECLLPTESCGSEKLTTYVAAVAAVGIDTVEASNFPALHVAVSLLLVGLLRLSAGISTCILVFAGRGRTDAFLVSDL